MDEKLKSLEEELGKTRSALKWQRTRCHHLVSALTVKLEQKESEVKLLRNLRESQLCQILRALLNLEARLRREQRSIRAQLGSRDAIIREQQIEITHLKKLIEPQQVQQQQQQHQQLQTHQNLLQQQRPISPSESLQSGSNEYEHHVKPDLISSLGIWNNSQKNNKKLLMHEKHNDYSLSQFSNNSHSLTPSISTDASESSMSTVIQKFQTKKSDLESNSNLENNIILINDNVKDENDSSKDRIFYHNMTSNHFDSKYNDNLLQNENCENIITRYDIDHLRPPSVDISIPESADSFTIIHDLSKIPETITPPEEFSCENDNLKHLPPSALLHEMQVQSKSGKNEYHDNPVLECVNQILLRDQEEFLEEQRVLRMREIDKNKSELQNLNRSKSREDLNTYNHHNIPAKEKINLSPNSKKHVQNYHDKPCLMTSTQLKLAGNVNYEEGRNNNNNNIEIYNHEPVLKHSHNLKMSPPVKNSIPPALPPKPLRLLNVKSASNLKTDSPKLLKQNSQPHLSINQQKFELNIRPNLEIIGKSSPALPEPTSDSELYVISNSALDDDLLQQIQGRNMKNCVDFKKVLSPEQKKPNEITTHASVHFPSGKKKEKENHNTPEKLSCSNSSSANSGEKRKNHTPNKSPSKNTTNTSVPQVIKVASPVSSLLATVESITNEQNDKGLSQSVLQIVQRFEHLGTVEKSPSIISIEEDGDNSLQKNFEEFRLDECDMDALCSTTDDDGRPEADGAENRLNNLKTNNVNTTTPATTVMPAEAGVSYENFLEATGLSQKSIMTPSRLFSNHRNVMKPKDVKHRSRVKAATTVTNSTVRYWTEPFL